MIKCRGQMIEWGSGYTYIKIKGQMIKSSDQRLIPVKN